MNFIKLTPAVLFVFLIVLSNGSLKAQKLPNKQTLGIRSPPKLKIDGKPTEWDDQYQAYNSATEIYYSITNTDSTVNLVVHAVKPEVIQKILENGVTFSILKNKTDKKNADVKVLFPSLKFDDAWKILRGADLPIGGFKKLPNIHITTFKNSSAPTVPMWDLDARLASQKEYSLTVANKQLITIPKEIRFLGIEGINDTVPDILPNSPYYRNFSLRNEGYKYISIYNEDDILAAIQLNDKKELTYELSLPIRYIQANIINGTFNYDITLNARDGKRAGVVVFYEPPPVSKMSFPELFGATNVEGEYTLAK